MYYCSHTEKNVYNKKVSYRKQIACQHSWAYLAPFPRKTAISVEIPNFSHPRVFNVTTEGVSLGIL